MNPLPELLLQFLQRLRRALSVPLHLSCALILALMASACGPGSGGTGVGPIAGSYLTFASSSGNSLTATAGLPTSSSFVATFDDHGIRLLGSCLTFQFEGAWTDVDGEVRASGIYRAVSAGADLSSASAMAATLVARAHANGLSVSVLDPKGAALVNFEFGTRLADASPITPPPSCASLATTSTPPPG